ncbi:Alpha/Beta hydrolase protein [Entophlyctis helioformis]|nr:Alpha/Beta hydrolase protein [Entophlyctis helioformis]
MPKVKTECQDGPSADIYYEVHGSGPHRILLINGLGSIAHQWDLQLDFLATFPDFSVCVFDNRGSGFSSSPLGRYTTKLMAQDTMSLLAHLGWTHVHIVGLSMGGMVAQELAYMLGDRVVSLCLVSTYAKFNGVPRHGIWSAVVGGASKTPTMESYCEVMLDVLFPPAWLNAPCTIEAGFANNREYAFQFFLSRFAKTGFQNPVGRAGQQVAVLSHYFDERLTHLSALGYPITVLTGDEDRVLRQPLSCEYLASRLNATLDIYKGGGHALRFQDPAWHNERMLATILRGIEVRAEKRETPREPPLLPPRTSSKPASPTRVTDLQANYAASVSAAALLASGAGGAVDDVEAADTPAAVAASPALLEALSLEDEAEQQDRLKQIEQEAQMHDELEEQVNLYPPGT